MSLRDLRSYVKISRNHDFERLLLIQRNVRRNRRASETHAMPNQNAQPKRLCHRRGSLGSSSRRSRQNSIADVNGEPPALAVQQPIVPLDEEFVQRLNMLAEAGDYSISINTIDGEIGEIQPMKRNHVYFR